MRHGLSWFFSQRPPHRLLGNRVDDVQFDELVGQELEGPDGVPLGRRTAGERDERRLAAGVELRGGAGPRVVVQRALEPLARRRLGEAPADPHDRSDARVQQRGHVGVERILGGEQQMGPTDRPGGRLASVGEEPELSAFRLAQLHAILLGTHATSRQHHQELPHTPHHHRVGPLVEHGIEDQPMHMEGATDCVALRQQGLEECPLLLRELITTAWSSSTAHD